MNGKKGTALVGAGSVNRSYGVFEGENPINVRMEKYQTKMKKKGAKFNKDGEMTTKPTPEMVKEFNMKFTTTKPSVKSMAARKGRLKK